jgi:LDH2 family malate/lactate/ureidoglycolate dehydrogenase
MAHAVAKAAEFGAGVVAVRHAFHFGTARRFSLAAAAKDCIGITMCNTRPLMPAPGGAERVVGNNPIAIAIPTSDSAPLVLDMATSEAAMGKIRMAAKSGTPIPTNWATAADGTPTSDPAAAIEGMLLPTAGPKGFGLAFVIDLMCGLLSGGAIGQAVRPLFGNVSEAYDCTHLFIAIGLSTFGNVAEMKQRAAAATAAIRGGARAPNTERLFTPGEPEWVRRQSAAGQLKLQPEVVRNLLEMAKVLRVPTPTFFDVFERTGS